MDVTCGHMTYQNLNFVEQNMSYASSSFTFQLTIEILQKLTCHVAVSTNVWLI